MIINSDQCCKCFTISRKGETTELEVEIECPRCYDAMILCSDFNSLYYLCEECNFCLYIQKK